ncbi:MAG: FtsX-like permease family protein, partial [Clostridiales bacterium]|nr:FtsX-like permease family protein [Clostridiales bacterium]
MRKMARDMRRGAAQFISVFLMAFLTAFIYSGVGGEWIGLQENSDAYYEETNLADMWLYAGGGIDDETAEKIKGISGVKETERRLALSSVVNLDGNPEAELYFIESGTISKTYLRQGEPFDPTAADGAWLDERFALARNIAVGDNLTFLCTDMTFTATVKGLVYSPEYVYMHSDSIMPDFYGKGFAFMPASAFPIPKALIYNQMLIKTSGVGVAELESKIDAATGGRYGVLAGRDDMESYRQLSLEIQQDKSMGAMFPPVFALVAILTLLTAMTRLIGHQRTQIGTLKALGISSRKIIFHYVGYGFWTSLPGSVLGVILGPLLIPPLFYPSMQAAYTLPVWKPVYDISFFITAFTVAALCTLAAYLACRKTLSLSPADTLRPGSPKVKNVVKTRNGRLWNSLGFAARWNLRDVSRNKLRSVMAAVGAAGCSAVLIAAFGMYADLRDMRTWQYDKLMRYDAKILFNEAADAETRAEILSRTGGEAFYEGAVEIEKGNRKLTAQINVIETGGSLLRFTDKDGKYMQLPEEGVSISYKSASLLGVKAGDTIRWRLYGAADGWKECRVASVHRAPTTQGLAMSAASFENFGCEFIPTAVLTVGKTDETSQTEGVKTVQYSADALNAWDELSASMNMLTIILVIAGIVLAAAVLFNLGALYFAEAGREL